MNSKLKVLISKVLIVMLCVSFAAPVFAADMVESENVDSVLQAEENEIIDQAEIGDSDEAEAIEDEDDLEALEPEEENDESEHVQGDEAVFEVLAEDVELLEMESSSSEFIIETLSQRTNDWKSYDVEKLDNAEHIFIVELDAQYNFSVSAGAENMKMEGSLPDGVLIDDVKMKHSGYATSPAYPEPEIESILNSRDAVYFSQDDVLVQEDGRFELSLLSARPVIYGGMGAITLYFSLDDGSEYICVIDSGVKESNGITAPSFVGLYDADKEELLSSEFQYTFHDTVSWRALKLSSHVKTLSVTVHNEGDMEETATGSTFSHWAGMQKNNLFLNGEYAGSFNGGTADIQILGPSFSLEQGWNVLEVDTEFYYGRVLSTGALSAVSTTNTRNAGHVFLIYWDGSSEGNVESRSMTDTGVAFMEAWQLRHTAHLGGITSFPVFAGTDEHDFMISLTDLEPYNSSERVLLQIKPADGMADFVFADSSIVLGSKVNGYTAINVTGLEEFSFEVIAADGNTKQEYTVGLTKASRKCDLLTVEAVDATLLSLMNTDKNSEPISFDPQITDYYLNFTDDRESYSVNITVSEDAAARLNGGVIEKSTALELKSNTFKNSVTVIAEDGYSSKTYNFFTLIDGENPYAGISDETKAQAKKMLSGWYANLAGQDTFTTEQYWEIFMVMATAGDDAAEYLDGAMVYDVSKHEIKQATDAAGIILQLVMLGENPYDFGGINYVEILQEYKDSRIFANDTWYVMAAKAAGIDTEWEDAVLANAERSGGDTDIRAWSVAAMQGLLTDSEMIVLSDKLHDVQVTSGDYTSLFLNNSVTSSNGNNPYTNGNVLMAITAAGVDPETVFAVGDATPLKTIEAMLMNEEGKFAADPNSSSASYVRDMIIGLGDIIEGSNVWGRYALTEEKYADLIGHAKQLGAHNGSRVLTEQAQNMPAFGTGDYGEKYFALYEAASVFDAGMKYNVTFGDHKANFIELVESVPEAITAGNAAAAKGTLEEAIAIYEDQLTEVQIISLRTESSEVMAKYHKSLAAVIALQAEGTAAAEALLFITALPDSKELLRSESPQVRAAEAAYNALDDVQKGYILWAGQTFTTNLMNCIELADRWEDEGGSTPTPDKMTVTIEIIGDSIHEDPSDHVAFETWAPKTSYTFNATEVSVYQVFMKAVSDHGLQQKGAGSNYVKAMRESSRDEWLEEFTNGPYSGWMYTVNGKHVDVGLQDYNVVNGDHIRWHYTDDHRYEEGSERWYGKAGSSSENITSAAAAEAKMMDEKTAAGTLSGSDLSAFVSSIKSSKDEAGSVARITVDVPKAAGALRFTVPNDVLKAMGETYNTALSISSNLGMKTLDPAAVATLIKDIGTKDAVFTVERIEAHEQREAAAAVTDGHQAYELSIEISGTAFENFGAGTVSVLLPYEPAEAEDAVWLTVYHIAEDGIAVKMEDAVYDSSSKGMVFTTSHFSQFGIAYEPAGYFDDVPENHWAFESILYLAQKGIISGLDETSFGPDANITRAEFTAILARMSGDLGNTAANRERESDFADVPEGSWYEESVQWAVEKRIAFGVSDSQFQPDSPISREDMAVMIQRYGDYKRHGFANINEEILFADETEIAEYAKEAVTLMQKRGIISGKDSGRFDPKATATRAEAARMLAQVVKAME